MTKKNIFGYVLVALGCLLIGGTVLHFGGTVENFPVWFYNGLNGGNTQKFTVSSNGLATLNGGQILGGKEDDVATTTYTPSIADLCSNQVSYYNFFPQAVSSTFALPASSTLTAATSCLATNGSYISFFLINGSTTAAADVAISNLTNSSSGVKIMRSFDTNIASGTSQYYLRSLSSSTPDSAMLTLLNASGTINVFVQQFLQ